MPVRRFSAFRKPCRMIRTIVSDLGNVLLHFDHMISCRKLARLCPWPAERIYESMFGSNLVRDYDLGRIPSSAFGEGCKERFGLRLRIEEIRGIWSDIFWPVEGMEEVIRALRGRYTLVLLSNTNEWHFEFCREKFPVVSLFDHYALSFRLGCAKPDPAIFERALAAAKAVPEETLYFDDIPAYVEAAARLGVRAVCFENRAQLERGLKEEGVGLP